MSARSCRILGAYTTCAATLASGPWTRRPPTDTRNSPAKVSHGKTRLSGRQSSFRACCAAVRGMPMRSTADQRRDVFPTTMRCANRDPNIPKSPWWFTEPASLSIGFRLLRPLVAEPRKARTRYWDADVDSLKEDTDHRIKEEGRGALGLVDPKLPADFERIDSERRNRNPRIGRNRARVLQSALLPRRSSGKSRWAPQ